MTESFGLGAPGFSRQWGHNVWDDGKGVSEMMGGQMGLSQCMFVDEIGAIHYGSQIWLMMGAHGLQLHVSNHQVKCMRNRRPLLEDNIVLDKSTNVDTCVLSTMELHLTWIFGGFGWVISEVKNIYWVFIVQCGQVHNIICTWVTRTVAFITFSIGVM